MTTTPTRSVPFQPRNAAVQFGSVVRLTELFRELSWNITGMYQGTMLPSLRDADWGSPGDFVKVDCAACLTIGLRRISAPDAAPFHQRRRVCARRADPPGVAPIRRSTRSARSRPMPLRRATTPFGSIQIMARNPLNRRATAAGLPLEASVRGRVLQKFHDSRISGVSARSSSALIFWTAGNDVGAH
jgi:hypothetical protein